MPRIPEADIERLKETVSLVALAEAAGVQLVRHGADWHGRCPYHADKTPSLVISPDKHLWHCLGACNTGGSAIDWVMRERGVPFRRAVELLRAQAGQLPIDASAAVPPRNATVIAPLVATADDAVLLAEVIGVYHARLQHHAEAQAYLARRGLTHPEVIATFRLGVGDRSLGYRLPEKDLAPGAKVRGQLQRLGVLRSSGHELFNGSLVVPITDAGGAVVNVYGRKLFDRQREGVPLHLYLPGPQRGVFNLDGWRGSEEVIVCEALIDALTFWCAGYRNVTSAYGVHGFTDELLQALVTHGVRRVLIAFDRDEAGDTAADALALKLSAHGIDSLRVLFPKGLDANAYALKVGPAAQSLGLVLKQAVPLGKAKAPPGRKAEPAPPPTSPVHERSSLAAAVVCESMPAPPSPEPLPIAAPAESIASTAPRATPAMGDAPTVEVSEQQVVIAYGDRRYRVRGLAKNLSADTLRVNVLASRGEGLHVDTFDLYAAKARAVFAKQTASALGVEEAVIERDLARLLLQLEDLQDATLRETLTPKPAAPTLTPEQHDAAMHLLRDPQLAQRIVHDVAAIGVVGEDSNALVGYLAAVSRKLERPLAILIQSTSAAGKSTLMDALLSLMPEAERVHYSAMTGQSLFYLGEGDLRHKILAIAEEEGVRQAAYALKLLQSQGELTIASTGKDPQTGKLITEEYRVEGPVMLLLTTTAIDLDEELLNRCLVLTINESREQTEAIHARQRSARTLTGLLATKHAEAIRSVHRAAQTLLRPLAVVNPYAEALTFRSESTRMRRDHAKYLTLIDAIALLHQHQRPIRSSNGDGGGGAPFEYVEVTLDDIALANRLAHEVLGRSMDALPPQTRRLLGAIVRLVAERCDAQRIDRRELRLGRADVRAVAGVSETQLRLHLERLVEMDYLLVHRGQRGQSFVYELLFDGAVDDATPQLVGLVDAEALRDPGTFQSSRGESTSSRGAEGEFAGSSRPQRGVIAAGSRVSDKDRSASAGEGSTSLVAAVEEIAPLRTPHAPATQRKPNGAVAHA